MFNIGGGELLVILLVALIVLGPQKLPEAARTVGRVVRELQRLSSGFQREFQKAIEDEELNDASRGRTTTRPEPVPLASVIGDLDDDELDDLRTGEPAPGGSITDQATPPTIDPSVTDGRPGSQNAPSRGNGPKGPGSGPNGADGNGHHSHVTRDDPVADEVGKALDEIVAASSPPGAEPDLTPGVDHGAGDAVPDGGANPVGDDAVAATPDTPAQVDDADGGDPR